MQLEIFDISHYSTAELTGSYSDDFEDKKTVTRLGKKSKACPTWDFDAEQWAKHRASYAQVIDRLVRLYPPASAF